MKLLVFSSIPTHPTIAGNRVRTLALLEEFKALGYEVHFAHLEWERAACTQEMKKYWGENFYQTKVCRRKRKILSGMLRAALQEGDPFLAKYQLDSWYDSGLDAAVRRIADQVQPDAVLVSYVYFSKILEHFDSSVLKLLDTQDVFSNRNSLLVSQKLRSLRSVWFSTSQEDESRGLNRADIVLAIDRESQQLLSQLSDRKVLCVGHKVSLQQSSPQQGVRNKILFLGSDNGMNIQGLKYFARDVLPKIRSKNPKIELIVAGKCGQHISKGLPGVEVLGFYENLDSLYRQVDLLVNPVAFGTGLPIKCIEALGRGKPLVCTQAGARGLEESSALQIATSSDDFANKVLSLLSDENQLRSASQKAYDYAQRYNLGVDDTIRGIVESLRENARPEFPAAAVALG